MDSFDVICLISGYCNFKSKYALLNTSKQLSIDVAQVYWSPRELVELMGKKMIYTFDRVIKNCDFSEFDVATQYWIIRVVIKKLPNIQVTEDYIKFVMENFTELPKDKVISLSNVAIKKNKIVAFDALSQRYENSDQWNIKEGIHEACSNGFYHMVEYLLKTNKNPINYEGLFFDKLFASACMNGHLSIAQLLAREFPNEKINPYVLGKILVRAIEKSDYDIVDYIFESFPTFKFINENEQWRITNLVVKNGDLKLLNIFIERGIFNSGNCVTGLYNHVNTKVIDAVFEKYKDPVELYKNICLYVAAKCDLELSISWSQYSKFSQYYDAHQCLVKAVKNMSNNPSWEFFDYWIKKVDITTNDNELLETAVFYDKKPIIRKLMEYPEMNPITNKIMKEMEQHVTCINWELVELLLTNKKAIQNDLFVETILLKSCELYRTLEILKNALNIYQNKLSDEFKFQLLETSLSVYNKEGFKFLAQSFGSQLDCNELLVKSCNTGFLSKDILESLLSVSNVDPTFQNHKAVKILEDNNEYSLLELFQSHPKMKNYPFKKRPVSLNTISYPYHRKLYLPGYFSKNHSTIPWIAMSFSQVNIDIQWKDGGEYSNQK